MTPPPPPNVNPKAQNNDYAKQVKINFYLLYMQ